MDALRASFGDSTRLFLQGASAQGLGATRGNAIPDFAVSLAGLSRRVEQHFCHNRPDYS